MISSAIAGIVKGLVTGVVGPLASAYEKKQDSEVRGFEAGVAADSKNYPAWLDFQLKSEAQKQQSNEWWGPRALYMIAGGAAVLHFVEVNLDSMSFFGLRTPGAWHVAKLPAPYEGYQGWVIASLFAVSLLKGPLSSARAWLDRR